MKGFYVVRLPGFPLYFRILRWLILWADLFDALLGILTFGVIVGNVGMNALVWAGCKESLYNAKQERAKYPRSSDPARARCEEAALDEFEKNLGKVISVENINGYRENTPNIIAGCSGVKVRVSPTDPRVLLHWIDDLLLPDWNVEIVARGNLPLDLTMCSIHGTVQLANPDAYDNDEDDAEE